MRILQVLNSFELDGPGNLVLRISERLASEPGLALGALSLTRDGPARDRYAQMNIPADLVFSRGVRGLTRLGEWLRLHTREPLRPDLIHTHLLWPDLALRLVRRNLPQVPLVSTIHGMHASRDKGLLAGLAYDGIERATRSRHSGWIAVSEAVRRDMIAAGYPEDRIEVIPNGVDALRAYPRPEHRRREIKWLIDVEESAPLIVAAGTLRPLKGHDILLRAMPEVLRAHPAAQLFVFGEGPSREELQKLAQSLGIESSVHLVQPLEEMIYDLFSAADVVAHPSRVEAFGLVVAEAGACGTPVVATRVGGIPEIVRDGETGLLVESEDVAAMACSLSQLLSDKEKRETMGQAARQHIVSNFEIGATARRYLQFWERHVGRAALEDRETEEKATA